MIPAGPILLRDRPVVPGSGPFIFGILNCTPDSFSDGGLYPTPEAAIEAGLRMADEGADAIDVGGESTRPGSRPVAPEEQIRRTCGVVAALAKRFGRSGPAISIDTRCAAVAEAALDAGAAVVNDVSALRDDPAMGPLLARRGAGVILMHMKGTPADMQINPTYENVVEEVAAFLRERVEFAVAAGIPRERIIIDPGIGFGKTTKHNLEILRRVADLRAAAAGFGSSRSGDLTPAGRLLNPDRGVGELESTATLPLMIGPSRKRFIREVLGLAEGEPRLIGTAAVVAHCVQQGVECLRVHDVSACRQAALIAKAIRSEQ